MEAFFKKKSTKREKDWKIVEENNVNKEIKPINLNRSQGNYLTKESHFPEIQSTDIRRYEKVGRQFVVLSHFVRNAVYHPKSCFSFVTIKNKYELGTCREWLAYKSLFARCDSNTLHN